MFVVKMSEPVGRDADPQSDMKQVPRETDPQIEPEPESQSQENQSGITHSRSQKGRARGDITRAREPDIQSQGASQSQRPERQNQKGQSSVSPAVVTGSIIMALIMNRTTTMMSTVMTTVTTKTTITMMIVMSTVRLDLTQLRNVRSDSWRCGDLTIDDRRAW